MDLPDGTDQKKVRQQTTVDTSRENGMPENNLISIVDALLSGWFGVAPEWLKSSLFSFAVAFIRITNDGSQKGIRRFLEALLCSMVTVTLYNISMALGMNESIGVGIGGFVGWFGTTYVRELVRKLVSKKIK